LHTKLTECKALSMFTLVHLFIEHKESSRSFEHFFTAIHI